MRGFKCFILVQVFLCSFSGLRSQTGNISGTVTESTTREPMQFATVALFREADTANALQWTTTDVEGGFLFSGVPLGKYFSRVSFVGFKTNRSPVFEHDSVTDLGVIALEATEILLEDVTITGEQNMLIHQIDKRVYLVGKDILGEAGSATEVLQNIPSVTVDVNGNVSLRGTSNILFLVNGRPSALLRRSAATALEQIPAATIERIEVITNPSARYRPEGTGGIINIVLKKEAKQGINGQVNAQAGNEERYNAGLILNYGTEAFNVFGNYSVRHSDRKVFYSARRIFRDSAGMTVLNRYDEGSVSRNDALAHIISAGAGLELNDQNSLELSGSYYTQNTFHRSETKIGWDDALYQPQSRITSLETNDEYEHEGEGTMVWERIIGSDEEHLLTTEATFSAWDEQEDLTFEEQQTYPDEEDVTEKIFIQKSGSQTELGTEYVQPFGEDSGLEAGYVLEITHEDIRYTNNDNPNRFVLDQSIHALYALYGRSIGKISFKTGLRAEQALVRPHLLDPIDSIVHNDYFRPYPTLHLAYELSENKSLRLSYSKRINRPDADELNPNPEFTDPRNAEAGNPELKPQQIHSLEFGYHHEGKKLAFTPTFYYRYSYDAFTSITKPIGDSIILNTIQNLDNRQSAGLEVIISGKPAKTLDVNLSADLFYDQIDATRLGYSEKKSVFSTNVKLYVLFDVTKTTLVQVNAFYFSPRITPQGQRDDYWYMNAGVKQQLFGKRVAVTLTASDVFHTYRVSRELDVMDLSEETRYRRGEAIVYFGLTWFFRPPENGREKELRFEGEGL
ncbi:MAG: TonB-dependent receptor [Bacteroidales bacterium]|nr:TonB-dependent receptor [Bacteroidales bacterium]